MGNLLNSIVFHPSYKSYIALDNNTYLRTKHGSNILIKEINMHENAKQYVIFSHANAEDIYSSYEWCCDYLLKYSKVSAIVYEYTGYNLHDQICEEVENNDNENYLYKLNNSEYSNIKVIDIENINNNNNNSNSYNSDKSDKDFKQFKKFSSKEEYLYNDIEAVYKYLINVKKVNPLNIIALGRSLGSGPSCYLAQKYEIGGLVLNSAFTSILRVGFNFRFTFFFDIFSNIDKIKRVNCFTLINHSIKDDVVPFEHSVMLYENIPDKFKYNPLFVEGTGHNNIDIVCKKYFKHLNEFLEYVQIHINKE